MKKPIITIILLILLLPTVVSSNDLTITTSYGETVELTIPQGLTIEDAYAEMARLYLEERHDLNLLADENNRLKKEVNKALSTLNEVKIVENPIKPLQFGVIGGFNTTFTGYHAGFQLTIYETVLSQLFISFPQNPIEVNVIVGILF